MARDYAPIEDTCKLIDSIISDIENVRSDNAALRDWGNRLYEENEELKNQVYDLEKKLKI